jgi:AcrR family transcriptional regulator
VGRWQPDAQGRLAKAALELFAERGYEQTTVAEIAQRAGLTKRTFFRYFADKREVLFGAGTEFQDLITAAAAAAPPDAAPLEAVAAGLVAAGAMLEERRAFARQRQAVIAANPELQERELMKLDSVTQALTATLRDRGAGELEASLAAGAGLSAFHIAFQRWVHGLDERPLPEGIHAAIAGLRAVAA